MTVNLTAIGSAEQTGQQQVSPSDRDCWSRIGVSGDRSCPELIPFVHCRNCPVFAAAARSFFNRPAPEGYLEEWSRWLARSDERDAGGLDQRLEDSGGFRPHSAVLSVLIFRLGAEYLAFRTDALAEVTRLHPVHRVPHRSNQILAGLVNLRGQVELCVSLHGLLGADASATPTRMVVLHDRDCRETWAFRVDEVLGVEYISRSDRHGVPSTLVNPAVGFSQAVLAWNGRSVGLLDEQRIFAALRRFGQ
ncbi:MAG: chemotaxis protein CheW [Isosphaeraceae bacterium]